MTASVSFAAVRAAPRPSRSRLATPAALLGLALALGATRAVAQAPAAAPIRPAPASALPPDSVRPAPAAAPAEPPANAVAQCRDGTFILPPNDASACATHRGVLVVLPQAAGAWSPVAPVSRALTPVAASRAAVPDAAPPAGATMRCKDGTYLFGTPAAGRCDSYGGLVAVLPPAREAPPPPLPRRP